MAQKLARQKEDNKSCIGLLSSTFAMEKSIGKESPTDGSPSEELKTVSPMSGGILEASCRINEKALLRKLDFRLLPPVTLLYLLCFLDRSNGIV